MRKILIYARDKITSKQRTITEEIEGKDIINKKIHKFIEILCFIFMICSIFAFILVMAKLYLAQSMIINMLKNM